MVRAPRFCVVRLDAAFVSAPRIRARSGAGSAFSIFIERASPDRAGARPYHAQWRITPFACEPGSHGSASLPRTIADHGSFACDAASGGKVPLPRDPALYVWWPISLARL